MKVIKANAHIYDYIDGAAILQKIEAAGRICYKSEAGEGTAKTFIENIIKRGHESVLEHVSVTVKFVVDRGVSHEIVRHRLASFSQESTRYCNYSGSKFGNEITVIEPCFFTTDSFSRKEWERACKNAEKAYFNLIKAGGAKAQEARAVLPNSLKTELFMTANIREWRHFFKLRTSQAAHPQMQEVTIPLLREFQSKIPVLFDDIGVDGE